MKRKVVCVGMLLAFAVQLMACGAKTCKVSGCNETNIYADGYCRYHYYENVGTNVLQDIFG